ncbi:hypothetical protein [Acrocarpospora sp. B8E8]|uniref:hypothetical protein n=1 Tax=Acrocarpospora sp. B8E8 TaxID=3153572 RepID=UPI00325F0270
MRAIVRVFGLPALLVLAWWAYGAVAGNFYMPDPLRVAQAFAETWLGQRLLDDALPSVGRLAAGYVVATVIGVGLGVPIGLSMRLRATAEPVLGFFQRGFQIAEMWSGILLLGLLGFALSSAFRWLERRILWTGSPNAAAGARRPGRLSTRSAWPLSPGPSAARRAA